MPLRERQPCTHVHACVNTYTHILPYVHRHAQHEHSTSHTYIIHTYIAHTHINSLTHTTHIHHMHAYIHTHKLTHHRPSITIILPLPLLTHSLTHILIHSPVHAHTYTHTHQLTHHHPSITLILPLPFLLFYAQSKSREVGNVGISGAIILWTSLEKWMRVEKGAECGKMKLCPSHHSQVVHGTPRHRQPVPECRLTKAVYDFGLGLEPVRPRETR